MKKEKNGVYHNDYSPRYQKPYDIYEKARRHMKKQKKKAEIIIDHHQNPFNDKENE